LIGFLKNSRSKWIEADRGWAVRQIEVSTDVFARIWGLREEGEDSEDQILRRVLLGQINQPAATLGAQEPGFIDRRHDIVFAHGFEIFRTYRGVPFSATAQDGYWHLSTGGRFSSLNELSRAVVQGSENAWMNWNFRDDKGVTKKISDLRDVARVGKRERSKKVRLQAEDREMLIWRECVVEALRLIGGSGHLEKIYSAVRHVRKIRMLPLPPSWEAIVRRELEYNSSDSGSFQGKNDLFQSVEGIGSGVWALRG